MAKYNKWSWHCKKNEHYTQAIQTYLDTKYKQCKYAMFWLTCEIFDQRN